MNVARELTVVKNGGDYAFYVDGVLQGSCWTEPRFEMITRYMGVDVLDLTQQGLGGQIDFIRDAPTLALLQQRMRELRRQKRKRRVELLEQEIAHLRAEAAREEEEETDEQKPRVGDK